MITLKYLLEQSGSMSNDFTIGKIQGKNYLVHGSPGFNLTRCLSC